jgi:TnpA family transposase
MGAAQAARHMRGISPHDLGATFMRHVTSDKLDRASAQVINAYLKLDIAKVWGDASTVAADGTMVETLLDNLLAEWHIRYGGYGGIAYHHVADNYIALFSHFIPCGVWEAVYIIEGLLKQLSTRSRTRSTRTRRGRATRCTHSRTCSGSSCSPGSATGRTGPSTARLRVRV